MAVDLIWIADTFIFPSGMRTWRHMADAEGAFQFLVEVQVDSIEDAHERLSGLASAGFVHDPYIRRMWNGLALCYWSDGTRAEYLADAQRGLGVDTVPDAW